MIYPDRMLEKYDSVGRLTQIQDRNHNKMEFLYDFSGRLSAVMDTMGRIIQLEYEPFETEGSGEETRVKASSGRLRKVEDFTGRALTFEYYDNGDLKSVDFEGRKNEYTYTENNDIALAPWVNSKACKSHRMPGCPFFYFFHLKIFIHIDQTLITGKFKILFFHLKISNSPVWHELFFTILAIIKKSIYNRLKPC
jgi:YD repeat-containing protein